MIDDEEREEIYLLGVRDARSGMAADLRAILDHFNSEIRELRREVCRLAGLPPPEPLGLHGYRDQDKPQ